MTVFAERLNELMNRYGITVNELSRRTGINIGTISHYKNGTYDAKATNIYLIAQAFKVSPGWLMGFDLPENEEKVDKEILSLWRQLTPEQQSAVLHYMQSLVIDHREEASESR